MKAVLSPNKDSWKGHPALVCISSAIPGSHKAPLQGASLPHERKALALKGAGPELFLALFPRPWKRPVLLKAEVTGWEDHRRRAAENGPSKPNRYLPFPVRDG